MISIRTKVFFYPAVFLTLMMLTLVGREAEMCQQPRVWPWGLLARYAPSNVRSVSATACPFDDPRNLSPTVVVLSWMCICGAMFLSVYMDYSRRVVSTEMEAYAEIRVEEPRVFRGAAMHQRLLKGHRPI